MHQPLDIRDVHNMSLENCCSSNKEWPHLVAQFPCENIGSSKCVYVAIHDSTYFVDKPPSYACCAVVWLSDSHNMTLKGISITSQTPGMSGVIVQHVTNMNIQFVTASSSMPSISNTSRQLSVGILISYAIVVEVHSSGTASYSYGFVFQFTQNTIITNITARYNGYIGMVLDGAVNSTIIGLNAMHSLKGMTLYGTTYTVVTNALVAHNSGGGMYLIGVVNTTIISPAVIFNGNDSIYMFQLQNIDIVNATVMHNSHNMITLLKTTNVHFINTSVPVMQSGGVSIEVGYILILSSSSTIIINSSFTGFVAAPNVASSADPTTHPAVIVLYDSSLYISKCNFTGNNISAVKAYASNITSAGDLILSNNRANAGTAFILVQKSILRLAENSHIHFSNNHAINIGGIFYITDNMNKLENGVLTYFFFDVTNHPLLHSTCFLNVEGKRSQVRMTFVNNSAGKGGDILYGGHVALGLDGDWNCADSFKNVSNISQNGLSLITSDPSRVCLCNETGQPDCLTLVDPTPHSIYPGQSVTIPAVVVGQQFGAIAGSVFANVLQQSATESSSQLGTCLGCQNVTQEQCTSLHFTIFSKNEQSHAVLALTATSIEITHFLIRASFTEDKESIIEYIYKTTALDPMKYPNNPVYVNISLLPCPPGFMLTTKIQSRCECNQLLQSINGVRCHIQDQTFSRSGLVWVGILQNYCNGTVAVSEYCPFDYCDRGNVNVTLSEPDSQCNYNHSGTLCGECQPGLSLALRSAQCLPCSNKYFALLIPFALAGPAVVFFIKLLDLTISQGTLNGLIFYAKPVGRGGAWGAYAPAPFAQRSTLSILN